MPEENKMPEKKESKAKDEAELKKVQSEKNESEQPAKKKKRKVNKALVWGLVASVLVMIIGVLVFVGVRIYRNQASDDFTVAVAKIVPFPAASVNGSFVSYYEVRHTADTLNHFILYQHDSYPDDELYTIPTEEEIFQDSLDLLVENTLIKKEASKRGIEATQDDIDGQVSQLRSQAEAAGQDLEETLQQSYQWTLDQFTERALIPQILQQKLAEGIVGDQDIEINQQAKEKIDEAYQKIQNEEMTFAEAVAEYSEDESTVDSDGNLGANDPDLFVEEFRDALVELEPGEISEPVLTVYGWHIVKLNEIVESEEGVKEYDSSHILVKAVDFATWLEQKLEEAEINIYVD